MKNEPPPFKIGDLVSFCDWVWTARKKYVGVVVSMDTMTDIVGVTWLNSQHDGDISLYGSINLVKHREGV
jgi:hypothetical protein